MKFLVEIVVSESNLDLSSSRPIPRLRSTGKKRVETTPDVSTSISNEEAAALRATIATLRGMVSYLSKAVEEVAARVP